MKPTLKEIFVCIIIKHAKGKLYQRTYHNQLTEKTTLYIANKV
jgi:hypothetical protein